MDQAIAFVDIKAQQRRLGTRIDEAIARVLDHGIFIMGPEVKVLEERLAAFAGATHCLSCASGTDALLLPLMARGIGRGDAVFVPSFTFVATAEVVALLGATPVFVDVLPDTFNIDPASLESAISATTALGLTAAAIIPVDMFGQPADYAAIAAIAARHGLWVMADAAQSFGGSQNGRRVGSLAAITATSFFPAKPLGCYGDGGAIFTDDDDLIAVLRSLRVHGQGTNKYDNVRIGVNGRLDTLQAAILIEKLAILEEEMAARQIVAQRYHDGLSDVAVTPRIVQGNASAWAQYTIKIENRTALAAALQSQKVPTAVYYPTPLHRQTGYCGFPTTPGGLPVSERLAETVISLPIHPYLEVESQDRIIGAVRSHLASK